MLNNRLTAEHHEPEPVLFSNNIDFVFIRK